MDMKRKILIVQHSANLDGSGFSALMLADGLQNHGWEVSVTFGYEGPMMDRFRDAGHVVSISPHKSWLRVKKPIRFIKNLIYEISASRHIEKLIKSANPDLVYINTAVSFAGAFAARRSRTPCIWHLRELFSNVGGEMRAPSSFLPAIRRAMLKLSDCIIVNSAAVAENMLGNRKGIAEVVPNAVNVSFFEDTRSQKALRSELRLPSDGPVIGVPGTLRPMKGHPFFFEALAELVKHDASVTAIVSGGGTEHYTAHLNELVHTLGISNNVRFMGYIKDMPGFYRACDIACIPSVAEPFGRTVIEAFATGIPVIASSVGGIRETVDDGRTGILIPYGDVEELSSGLANLLKDSHLRKTLGNNAKKDAKKRFTESIYKDRLCQIILDIVSKIHNK